MTTNMSYLDRIIRVLIALIIAILYAYNIVQGTVAIVLLALAGIFLVTSAVGFCPLYRVFGISTCKTVK